MLCYQGQNFSEDGMSADTEKTDAINKLEKPTNVVELRRLLGMVNYLGRYAKNLATVLKPLSELLKNDVEWVWDHAQEKAFKDMKNLITTAPVLAYYDQTKPTTVSADASSYGIGGVILQDDRPIAFCSRVLSPAERNYAQIEKELLASVWTCEKFSRYLVGLENFKLITDHKPLVPIINKKGLDDAPLRCQRLLIRMMKYNPIAEHVPGKLLVVADALSRQPIQSEINSNELEEVVNAYVNNVVVNWPISDNRLNEIVNTTKSDSELKLVMDYCINGWPKSENDVSPSAKDYFCARGQLSIYDGIIIHGDKIVIPKVLREDILNRIHSGHQGITKCQQRANSTVWWPRITKDIQRVVESCDLCQKLKPSQQREPMISTPIPANAWDKIGVDLFDFRNKKFLVVVDYFSRFIEMAELHGTTSKTVIGKLKGIVVRHGLCVELVSDNGPPFNSAEFAQFAKEYGFTHTFSSPHFPQSNGEAERAVQTAKKILSTDDPYIALLAYRTTPHCSTGYSPAQLSMGRKFRTTLPTLDKNIGPDFPDIEAIKSNDKLSKAKYKFYYDKRHGSKTLNPLSDGNRVRIKLDGQRNWSSPFEIKSKTDMPRSYTVNKFVLDNDHLLSLDYGNGKLND